MFTGLIEKVGELKRISVAPQGGQMDIAHSAWDNPLQPGDSVAVQGVCLTVSSCSETSFSCEVLETTVATTCLDAKNGGDPLNLERALKYGDRLGGHIVSGHVDGVGRVSDLRRAGRDWIVRVKCDRTILAGIVLKGSVACDGVSLTVSELAPEFFEMNIIPFTWQHTSLRSLQLGDMVNLEEDMLGKYVRRHMESRAAESSVTLEGLQRAGFA